MLKPVAAALALVPGAPAVSLVIVASPAQATQNIPDVPKTFTDSSGVVHHAFDSDSLPGAVLMKVKGWSWAWDSSKGGDCSSLLWGNYYVETP